MRENPDEFGGTQRFLIKDTEVINCIVPKLNVYSLKIPVTKLKRQATKWENISTKHVCIRLDKMLYPEYIKSSYYSPIRKQKRNGLLKYTT